jgi:hypothetical protein
LQQTDGGNCSCDTVQSPPHAVAITTQRRLSLQQQQLVRVSAAAAAAAAPLQHQLHQQQYQRRRGCAHHRVRCTTPLFCMVALACVALRWYVYVLNHINDGTIRSFSLLTTTTTTATTLFSINNC